jgi:hypothetical protein
MAAAGPVRRRQPGGPSDAPGEIVVTDLRRGGWSWGWDTLAREFAAILHQTGVGVYFTYAAYTDNRKDSPYRGSSYTGVEALADFSGESAEDIRTINKLLAALGLARFETYTVPTVGSDGRRATRNRLHCYLLERDPHLRFEDVLAVLRLALTDEKVYRYIRHLFRPSFRPIDRAEDSRGAPREHPNPWYEILPRIKATPEWRALALRAERDYLALRARNLPGVEAAARRRGADATLLPITEDAVPTRLPATEDALDLPPTEPGSAATLPPTDEAPTARLPRREGNQDQESVNQTNPSEPGGTLAATASAPSDSCRDGSICAQSAQIEELAALLARVNGRPPTPSERDLLVRTAAEVDAAARAAVPSATGFDWVRAAVSAAATRGAHRISPRRIRAICRGWAAAPAPDRSLPGPPSQRSGGRADEMDERELWRRVLDVFQGSRRDAALLRRLAGCVLERCDRSGRVAVIRAPDAAARETLAQTCGRALERAFVRVLGHPVALRWVASPGDGGPAPPEVGRAPVAPGPPGGEPTDGGGEGEERESRSDGEQPAAPGGMGKGPAISPLDHQLWSLALAAGAPEIPAPRRRLLETHAMLGGRVGEALIVVAANSFVQEQARLCAPALARAIGRVLGRAPPPLRVLTRAAYERLVRGDPTAPEE